MRKKILILGLATVYLSMAVACNKGDNSGSMADNSAHNSSSAQDNNSGITGTGGANANDNISLVDDAENVLDNIVDGTLDGISDLVAGDDNITDTTIDADTDANVNTDTDTDTDTAAGDDTAADETPAAGARARR